jgi:hypothetical protein
MRGKLDRAVTGRPRICRLQPPWLKSIFLPFGVDGWGHAVQPSCRDESMDWLVRRVGNPQDAPVGSHTTLRPRLRRKCPTLHRFAASLRFHLGALSWMRHDAASTRSSAFRSRDSGNIVGHRNTHKQPQWTAVDSRSTRSRSSAILDNQKHDNTGPLWGRVSLSRKGIKAVAKFFVPCYVAEIVVLVLERTTE